MTNDVTKKIEAMNKTATDSVQALAEINLKAARSISEKQFEIFNICFDAATKQVGMSADVKDLNNTVKAQTELARATGEKIVAVANSTQEIAGSYKNELTSWVEKGVEAAKKAA